MLDFWPQINVLFRFKDNQTQEINSEKVKLTLSVLNDLGSASFHDSDARVSGTQINANNTKMKGKGMSINKEKSDV